MYIPNCDYVLEMFFSQILKERCIDILLCFLHRHAASEAKKQNHQLMERVQQYQNELSDNELRRMELEGQIRNSQGVSYKLMQIPVASN